ncbi:MAG TPA: hypothetical protein VKE42_07765 [Candidatus Cybelea sp.]|nr:hypothetical protein [Candidatus Cybelea sp.]
MTVEETAANIKAHIERMADEAAERYDRIHGRTEDWLDERFRRMCVRNVVRAVLVDYLLGNIK